MLVSFWFPLPWGRRRAPREGCSRPARIWSSVDLPQPEGPRRMRNSPGITSRVIDCRATVASPVRAMDQVLPMSLSSTSTRAPLLEEREVDGAVHGYRLLHPAHLLEPRLQGGEILNARLGLGIDVEGRGRLDGVGGDAGVARDDAGNLVVLRSLLEVVADALDVRGQEIARDLRPLLDELARVHDHGD